MIKKVSNACTNRDFSNNLIRCWDVYWDKYELNWLSDTGDEFGVRLIRRGTYEN